MHPLLPPEIWIEIFRWATSSEGKFNFYAAEYIPFQATPNGIPDSTISIKSTLALVCREWRRLTTEFLYEDLRILYGVNALRNVLEKTDGHGSYARWVRRVVLPYPSTVTGPHKTLPSIEILKLCTNLEILVRPRSAVPDALQFHFDAERPSLHSLRRLDWWHHNEAERSGGINSLGAVLHSAPNLRYLSVGGVIGYSRISMESVPLCLPELQTLRLHGTNGLLLRQIVHRWSLPALSRVIVDFPLAEQGLHIVWETFGPQLTTVEFGKHVRFLMNDNLAPCLRGCPNLIEMNYFVFFTAPPEMDDLHPALTTIGLHASVNSILQDADLVCSHIEKHFDALTNTNFPALQRIILYGEWRGLISYKRLAPMWQRVFDRGLVVELYDRILLRGP